VLGQAIADEQNELGQLIVDAQNELGQLTVDSQNALGQAVSTYLNIEITRQDNSIRNLSSVFVDC
jgi:hypothetical protein